MSVYFFVQIAEAYRMFMTSIGPNCQSNIPSSAMIIDMIAGIEVKPRAFVLFGIMCGVLGSVIDSLLVRKPPIYCFHRLQQFPGTHLICAQYSATSIHFKGSNIASNLLRQREEMHTLCSKSCHNTHFWKGYFNKCPSECC